MNLRCDLNRTLKAARYLALVRLETYLDSIKAEELHSTPLVITILSDTLARLGYDLECLLQ
jgi:hypothetical protein